MTLARLSNGQELRLGRKLAEGGEGRIHELNGDNNHLVKLYHKPADDVRHRKLIAMTKLRTDPLEAVAAWPIDVAYDAHEDCIGFMMPRISGPGIIDKLSHPAEQRIAFPTIDFGFLVHVALNLMRAASTLHASGCVIGDVNESNVYILGDGTLRFIDVDSFQVQHNGDVFPCNVGTPIYTPPELQGATFRDVTRTPTHDIFGLAVLAFQLLVQGCHPFAGIPRDGRGRTIEEAICEGLYAHSFQLRDRVSPPPDRIPVSALGEVAGFFERSFLGCHRPTAAEWMNALDRLRGKLGTCTKNPRHIFPKDCGECPLCRLPRDPFPNSRADRTSPIDMGGISIGELTRQAGQLSALRPLTERCAEPDVLAYERVVPTIPPNFPAAPTETAKVEQFSIVSAAGALLLIAGIVSCFSFPLAGIGGFLLGALLLGIGKERANEREAARVDAASRAAADFAARQTAALRAYQPLRQAALSALSVLEGHELQASETDRSAICALGLLTKEASETAEWLSGEMGRLQKAIDNAASTYHAQILTDHLRKQMIAQASIDGIRVERTALLASFGMGHD